MNARITITHYHYPWDTDNDKFFLSIDHEWKLLAGKS